MKEQPTNYLTTSSAARRLNLGVERVRQLANAGRLTPAIITSTGHRLFTEAEVERFREAREHVEVG